MNELETKIKDIANDVLSINQMIVNVLGDIDAGYVKIILDGEKNISLRDTTRMTKLLKKSTDFTDLFPKGFRLEVTSPGLDSPLMFPFQFKKNIGRKINITLKDKFDNLNVEAIINDANKSHLCLIINNEKTKIEYKSIIVAKLKILFN
jgi:ribosome maturation factor RimP